MSGAVAAVDLGATSGRVFVGRVSSEGISIQSIARFPNRPLRLATGLHWDIGGLWTGMVDGLRRAGESTADLTSVGIDAWGADYGLLRSGRLLGLPHHYRDSRTEQATTIVHDAITPESLYQRNGLEALAFNSIYQLVADSKEGVLDATQMMLPTPDLLGYWLTGRVATEPTIASTTGLLDVRNRRWDIELLSTLGLPESLLPPLLEPGDVLGPLTAEALAETGLNPGITVRKVASHDTASAVVGTPLGQKNAAYLSCGTWALLGVELQDPVLDERSRLGRFTNEAGLDGSILLQKNLMGLGLVSGLMSEHPDQRLEDVLRTAAAVQLRPDQLIDPADAGFLRPGSTTIAILDWFVDRSVPAPMGLPGLVRCVLESLAEAFARAIDELEKLTAAPIPVIHIVGGGSQNALLCQATADRAQRPVMAGPVEASVIGSILVQARAQGDIEGDIAELRRLVRRSFPTQPFEPKAFY